MDAEHLVRTRENKLGERKKAPGGNREPKRSSRTTNAARKYNKCQGDTNTSFRRALNSSSA